MTLTKMIIAEKISNQTGKSKNESHNIIEALIEIMKRNLESGNDILIPRFGKFHVIDKQARPGRNPKTGDRLVIKPRKRVMFKRSRKLKSLLKTRINALRENGGEAEAPPQKVGRKNKAITGIESNKPPAQKLRQAFQDRGQP